MNFKGRVHNKIAKYTNLLQTLEGDLEECEDYDKEAGADLRWSIINLSRCISGLRKAKEQ